MAVAKVAVTVDQKTLEEVDRLVRSGQFPNRSKAFQLALETHLARLSKARLARECSKLDPEFERKLAEESLGGELDSWPEY